jgi:adenylate cyclase
VGLAVVGIVVALVLLVLYVGVRGFFNALSPVVDSRRRVRDDNYFFNGCKSGLMSRYRWINRHVPAPPRCKFCLVPFGGLGRLGGIKPSRKNPNFCRGCFEMAPLGGYDMEIGVLFADIRGFTAWCESQPPEAVARTLNRFYATASEALMTRDGLVDKLVGDEIMGLFLTVFPSLGDHTCDLMVDAAHEILSRIGDATVTGSCLPVGVGLNFGVARVGNVGAGEVKDFTAVGDVVNTAARLQSSASPGEILMSAAVYERVAERFPDAAPRTLVVKGKHAPVAAYSVRIASTTRVAPS